MSHESRTALALSMIFMFASGLPSRTIAQTNTLLQHARKVTTFSKEDLAPDFGYHWVSATEIVFQRQGGYIQRNTETGAEQEVKGCPKQDKEHWFGGNLGADVSADGVWMVYNGRRGNEESDDGALRVDRTDGSAQFSWSAEKYPELVAMHAFWLADNETWACPTWEPGRYSNMSGIVLGSVRKPGEVRWLKFAKGAAGRWHIIGATRDRLLATEYQKEHHPHAVSSLRVTELVFGTKITKGRNWVIRLPKPVYEFCEGGLSSKGQMLWSCAVRGNPWEGQLPMVTVVSIWKPGDVKMREVGRVTTTKHEIDGFTGADGLRWLPDGKRFSFMFRRSLYVAWAK